MKKIAVLLFCLLLLLIIGLTSIFYWRKHQAQQQYVSKQSTAILAIGIDDYVVDNLFSLLQPSKVEKRDTDKLKSKDLFFKSGLVIPSRLFLFTTEAQPNQLVGHLAVNNSDKAKAFFKQNFKDKLSLHEDEDSPITIRFNAHIVALLTKQDFFILLSKDANPSTDALQTLLTAKKDLVEVQSLRNLNPLLFKAHIAFSSLTNDFSLAAFVKDHQLQLSGEWKLKQSLTKPLQARAMDSTQAALTFWNCLPLEEVPLLSHLLTSFSGMETEALTRHYANYIDMEVLDSPTLQTDTIINYSYDDDFNPTEEVLVREVEVPKIRMVWSNEKKVSPLLPDRMFYNFYKKEENGFVVHSTFIGGHDSLELLPTATPLALSVNFQKWPKAWTIGFMETFKEHGAQLQIQARQINDKKLAWKGYANWQP